MDEDSKICPLTGQSAQECELRIQALEDSLGLLLTSHESLKTGHDTTTATLKQLRNQLAKVNQQVAGVARIGTLIEAQDGKYQEILRVMGKVLEVQEQIFESVGNGRGGK